MKWTQLQVTCTQTDLDTVCAVMSMIDAGLMIEDYSDIEENLMTVYGELIENADGTFTLLPSQNLVPAGEYGDAFIYVASSSGSSFEMASGEM